MFQLFTTIVGVYVAITAATIILGVVIWGTVFYITRNFTKKTTAASPARHRMPPSRAGNHQNRS